MIADLTTRNPNVFYELGIAHTHKDQKEVIVLTQSIEDVPVDLRHLFCVLYEASQEGLVALQRRVVDSIRAVTPADLRFVVSQGESRKFQQRLASQDLRLYELEVGPLIPAVETAEFRLVVRRCSVDTPDKIVSEGTYQVTIPGTIEIPFLDWMLSLDGISGEKAHFCLCKPERNRAAGPSNHALEPSASA